MFRHVVLLTWKPDTTDEQIEQVKNGLSTLPRLVPGIRDYRFGADAGLVEATLTSRSPPISTMPTATSGIAPIRPTLT